MEYIDLLSVCQELLNFASISSTSYLEQSTMVIPGHTAAAHLAKSLEFFGLMVQGRVFSHTLLLQVPPKPSISSFQWEVALKSHSACPCIKVMVHKEYFCLKWWTVQSMCKNCSLIIKSGWDFENSSEIMLRNFNTAVL